MRDVRRQRRSLTHVGGTITTAGHADDARRLAHALAVLSSAEDDTGRAHVHGFHTYPARLHPDTAARLVRGFVPAGGSVLDPFCGSGTVLVEALLAGDRPLGTDLNPLAVLLARAKTRPRPTAELDRLVLHARRIAGRTHAQRRHRGGDDRWFEADDVRQFEPHVLRELDTLRAGIDATPDANARLDLLLVLSSILVKLSRRAGDTSTRVAVRRTTAGFPSRLFVQKAEEWANRLVDFGRLLPASPAAAVVNEDDATRLTTVTHVDAIVTSPPYAATYDYVQHHALRLRWLGLDASPLEQGELGARAAYEQLDPLRARERWASELARFLQAAGRRLPPNGPLVLVMADSAVGSVALRADVIVADVARAHGFIPSACASQDRPHFHGPTQAAFRDGPRREHAIALRRA